MEPECSWGKFIVHDALLDSLVAINEAGCAGIEVDVTVTKDGHPVVMPPASWFDKESSRCRIRSARFQDLSTEYFVSLDSLYERIFLRSLRLFVDLKANVGEEADFMIAINRAGVPENVTFASFNHRLIRQMSESRQTRTAIIVGDVPLNTARVAAEASADSVIMQPRFLSLDESRELRGQGIEVITWTAATTGRLQEAFSVEPDMVMIDQDLLRAEL